jgi:hypothetical protein
MHPDLKGCQISARFWNDNPENLMFKGPYDGPETLKPPERTEDSSAAAEDDEEEEDDDGDDY